jgi:hypothetical protein
MEENMARAKLSKAALIKVFTRVPNGFVDDFYDILKDKKRHNKIRRRHRDRGEVAQGP